MNRVCPRVGKALCTMPGQVASVTRAPAPAASKRIAADRVVGLCRQHFRGAHAVLNRVLDSVLVGAGWRGPRGQEIEGKDGTSSAIGFFLFFVSKQPNKKPTKNTHKNNPPPTQTNTTNPPPPTPPQKTHTLPFLCNTFSLSWVFVVFVWVLCCVVGWFGSVGLFLVFCVGLWLFGYLCLVAFCLIWLVFCCFFLVGRGGSPAPARPDGIFFLFFLFLLFEPRAPDRAPRAPEWDSSWAALESAEEARNPTTGASVL